MLERRIVSEPEGGTLWVSEEKKNGFIVSRPRGLVTLGAPTAADLEPLVRRHSDAPCFGWWSFEDELHVDGNDWFATRGYAERVGRERKQIAIWDIARECEIFLEDK